MKRIILIIAVVIGIAACSSSTTTTVVPTSPPQSPTQGQTYQSAYALGQKDARVSIGDGLGPSQADQTASQWCDTQLYGGMGAENDGGNAQAWYAGCLSVADKAGG